MPVRIAKVIQQTFAETLNATGVVTASEIVVEAKVQGKVAKISAPEGSAVKCGEIIVELDKSVFQINVSGAKNALEQAKSNLAWSPGVTSSSPVARLVKQRQAVLDYAQQQLALLL
jgi:multidrug efflux pump subunit AcrA (membrane-fusion protein)